MALLNDDLNTDALETGENVYMYKIASERGERADFFIFALKTYDSSQIGCLEGEKNRIQYVPENICNWLRASEPKFSYFALKRAIFSVFC